MGETTKVIKEEVAIREVVSKEPERDTIVGPLHKVDNITTPTTIPIIILLTTLVLVMEVDMDMIGSKWVMRLNITIPNSAVSSMKTNISTNKTTLTMKTMPILMKLIG